MLTPSLNTVMTRLLIVAAVLGTVVFFAPAIFAQEGPVEYEENGTGAVITFTSTDPENGMPGAGIDWDVTGLDADDFMIDERGRLMFRNPPDYENPTDRGFDANNNNDFTDDGDFAPRDRMYQITVRATEQETSGSDPRALSTESHFTIEVTDANEPGDITLNRIQPEVGTPITAKLNDPDGTRGADPVGSPTDITWQWYVSKVTDPVVSFDDHWETVGTNAPVNIDITMSTYTPAGDRVTDTTTPAMDEGKYLRAVAMYTDRHGASRTARVKSENPVRAEVTSDSDNVENPENGSPGFSSAGVYTRSIFESAMPGSPVDGVATSTDPNGDVLTYELDNDTDPTNAVAMVDDGTTFASDVSFFSIDDETAQISLRKKLSFEATDGRDYDGTAPDDTAGIYKFYVRATDPSGEFAQVEMTVTAMDANDAPKIMGSVAAAADGTFPARPVAPAELTVNETAGGTFTGGPDMLNRSLPGVSRNVFTASDEDARGQIFWTIKGVDVDDFELTQSSPDPITGLRGPDEPIALRFKTDPDFENPTDDNLDGVYKVTLVATDSDDGVDERPLTIFVRNVQEDGTLELDVEQPTTDNEVTASVSDPDNGVAVVTWRWERATSTTATTWEVIDGATTASYTPLRTEDHNDVGYFLRALATYTDIMSHKDDSATVLGDERTQNVDTSTDPDTVTAKNPETAADNLYRVMVVSDNAVRVPPDTPTEDTAPQFAESLYELQVAENAEKYTLVGSPVAVEPEADTTFNYSLEDSITGDEAYFIISTTTGQIRVAPVAFPNPTPAEQTGTSPAGATSTDPGLDYESKSTYNLIVTATDASNDTREAMVGVTVTLVNLNERPYFDKASRETAGSTIMYSEHRTNAVIPMLAAVEPDGEELRWELLGDDADDFDWVDVDDLGDGKDRIALVFKSQPNFESGTGSDTSTGGTRTEAERAGDMYSLRVRATEVAPMGAGPAVSLSREISVTVQVTDYNEPGSVELNWLQPEQGTAIMATLSDPDDESSPTWSWYRSKANNPNPVNDPTDADAIALEWELITGETDDAYTPGAADVGKFLLARVIYTDTPGGADQAAVGRSANTVRADVSDEMNNSPDFNTNETTRSIPEDTVIGGAVGIPVDVDRNEDGDILTYEIVKLRVGDTGATPSDATTVGNPGNNEVVLADLPFFSIDKATGQLMVARMLSAEETDGRTYTGTGATSTPGQYTVVVRATDPSGEPDSENRDDIVVKITATDVDEAPTISEGAAELSVDEVNSTAGDAFVGLGYELDGTGAMVLSAGNPNLYHRSEEDSVDRAEWPEPIAGPDGHLFEYSTPADGIGRRLHFKRTNLPDYEAPADANADNVYEVTIRVEDQDDLVGEKKVQITVNNVDETGEVMLLPEQPDSGMPVMASLSDPDVVLSITNWEWATSSDSTLTTFPETSIVSGASMSEYTGKVGEFLWVRVSYRDGQSVKDDPVTVHDERNDDPAAAVGTAPVDTFDTDRTATSSTANAVQPEPDGDNGGSQPSGGVKAFTLMVYENVPSTGYVGDPIPDLGTRDEIGGPDFATFVLAEAYDGADSVYYDGTTTGTDDFGLRDPAAGTDNDKAGQLALASVTHLDYESSKNSYVIEITNPEAETELSVYRVTINVLDVNEAPTAPSEHKGPLPVLNTEPMFLDANGDVATSTTRSVAENTAAGADIGEPVRATDSDRGDQETIVYTLGGADAASFAIDSATGQLRTSAPLDFETDNEFMVTVTATDDDDASSMIYVTIMVTDVGLDTPYDANEDGTIDSAEVLAAVADYFSGDIDAPTVLAVVADYFAGL